MQYVKINDSENGEAIEIPTEDNGNLLLASISAQYPEATGLKYRIGERNRAIRIINNEELCPPEDGWGDITYYCTFPKNSTKRKAEDAGADESESKTAKADSSADDSWANSDLVVLGLPWKTTDEDLKKYFSTFGDLQFAQVKTDPFTKKSKGYGFIRFANKESQVRVMLQRHQIDGRWCDVKVPVSKESTKRKSPYKIFVGQCTEDMTEDVLRKHFEKFGEISDLYVPKPFRAFAFITFTEANAAKAVCGQEHHINSTKVNVTEAIPKSESGGGGHHDRFDRGFGGRGGRGDAPSYVKSSSYDNYYDGGSRSYNDGPDWYSNGGRHW